MGHLAHTLRRVGAHTLLKKTVVCLAVLGCTALRAITDYSDWNKEYLPKASVAHNYSSGVHDLKATGQQPSLQSGITSNQRLKTVQRCVWNCGMNRAHSNSFYQAPQHCEAFKFSHCGAGNVRSTVLSCANRTFTQ